MPFTPVVIPTPQLQSWKPKLHHKLGVEFLLEHSGGGLFMQPGMGKTAVTLRAFTALKKAKQAHRMLVIAPLRVCYRVWPEEVKKWKEFAGLKVEILHDKNKNDAAIGRKADVYVINPDGTEWLFTEERLRALNADTLVIDESSLYKHTTTQRYKTLKPLLNTFDRRWILTGTPAPNGLLDLFGQLYVCDLGAALGPFITHYRSRYFHQTGFGGYTYALNDGAEEEIYELIKPSTLSMDAKDYIDMPEDLPNYIRVDMPAKARKIYDDMEEELFAQLDARNSVEALNAAGAANKCGQIANGGLYTDRKENKWKNIHAAKIDALQELVDELNGSPLLCAYDTHHDLDRLKKAFKKAVCIADIPVKHLGRFENAWNRGDIELAFGQPQGMGHGLNLQGYGNNVCWHSMTYDYELYDQFNRRVWRSGQKHAAVYIHHIIVNNTVDEAKLRAIDKKNRTQRGLFDALKAYRKERRK